MIPEIDDPETRRLLRRSPKHWVRNAIQHPIDPTRDYDFYTEDGDPLTHLLHDDSWLYPENWGDINVLLLARGEMKSTTTGWLTTWAHDGFPQFHTYMIAPSNDQVIDFLEPVRQTYVEMADMHNRRVTDNKRNQVFKSYQQGEDGELNPVMGRIQTDTGYTEESVRGKHSQLGITEETQDLTQRVFNVFLPSIDQGLPNVEYFPTVFCIGTPKETGSHYHDLWERSDKKSWDAETGEWVAQDEVEPYKLSADELSELNVDPDTVDFEEESYTVRGWHVDWINSPLHSMADVARAKQQMDEMEFANEVLAEFYEPEDNLLSNDDVKSAFDTTHDYRTHPHSEDNDTVVVADWGGGTDQNASDTVFMAVERQAYEDDSEEYIVLDIDFLDTDLRKREQIREYESWLIQYDADVGLVDYGFGTQALESLHNGDDTRDVDGYVDTVSAAKFGNVKDRTEIKWSEDEDGNDIFFTCDKSRSATRMVESFRDDQWIIPRATSDSTGISLTSSDDDGVRLIDQLTAPYKTLSETKTSNKRIYIETPGNQRDDAFDVFTFAWLALHEVADDTATITDFTTTARV